LVYSTFVKRNFTFLGVIFASAFAFEMYVQTPRETGTKNRLLTDNSAFDITTDRIWDNINKGVRFHLLCELGF
jgi:ubiquinol-cytochrome c reductase subunit 9